MRIVAGQWRGRRIRAPRDERVRPTADRVREAWMSIVNDSIPGARVLDLFAGSGALGLEALSRGAASAEFVEISQRSIEALRDNISQLGASSEAVVVRKDAIRFIRDAAAGQYDLAFADPPYGLGLATRVAEAWLNVRFSGVLGIEHRVDEVLPGEGDRRRYGDTVITLYRN